MSGITNNQFAELRHIVSDRINKQHETLCQQLWYSTTSQAYIQRFSKLDNSFLSCKASTFSANIEAFTLLLLYRIFHLDGIGAINDKIETFEYTLLSQYSKKENILLIGEFSSHYSDLFSFDDKLRNTIAHGTFNIFDDQSALFIGQGRARQESPLNFYMRIANFSFISEWQKVVQHLPTTPCEFLSFVYGKFHDIKKTNNPNLFIRSDNSYIFFDTDFHFQSVKHTSMTQDKQVYKAINNQIQTLGLDTNTPLYYFIPEKCTSTFEPVKKAFPQTTVVPANLVYDHLKINYISKVTIDSTQNMMK